MAVDIQVASPQQIVPLSSVTELPGFNPRAIQVVGTDFSTVDQVLINDIPSPDIVIVTKTTLWAQVPDPLVFETLTSVTVTSRVYTLTTKSLIKFQLGSPASKVSGIFLLMQRFLKVLLTTPGQDIFAPRIGGNALAPLGATYGADQSGNIVSDFIVAVSTAQRQLISIQSRDPSIPASERLLSAKVTAANYNVVESALIVGLALTSQAGQQATANLMV